MKKEKLSTYFANFRKRNMEDVNRIHGLAVLMGAYAKQVTCEKEEILRKNAAGVMAFIADALWSIRYIVEDEVECVGDRVKEVEALEKKAAEAKE